MSGGLESQWISFCELTGNPVYNFFATVAYRTDITRACQPTLRSTTSISGPTKVQCCPIDWYTDCPDILDTSLGGRNSAMAYPRWTNYCSVFLSSHTYSIITFCINGITAYFIVEAQHHWWPGLPRRCCKGLDSLPPSITSAPSLLQFRRVRKAELFRRSYWTRVTERHWMNTTANVTVALQSSWKTISVALKFVLDADDERFSTR